jgi:hypothetical protein
MAPAEAGDLVAMILKRPRKYRPATLRRLLRLTEDERDTLEITTIRAFDATDESMKANRQRKKREAKTAQRRSKGSVSREEYETKSTSRTKPWEAEGVSRRTWYRRRGTSPSPALEYPSYADAQLVPLETVRVASPSNPKSIQIGGRRKPEPHHSKTAIERKGQLERKAACVATSGPSLGEETPMEGSDSGVGGALPHACR